MALYAPLSASVLGDSSLNYGVRSLASSFGGDGDSRLFELPTGSPGASSTTSDETTLPAPAHSSDRGAHQSQSPPPPVTHVERFRQATNSPAPSFASSFDHLSDASRPGLLSANASDTEEIVASSKGESGSDHDQAAHHHHHESQLVMPTLLLRAHDAVVLPVPDSAPSETRLCIAGRAGDLLDSMFGSHHPVMAIYEWPVETDPNLAVQRLEEAFAQAQRILRDDIPRELQDTLIRVLVNLPDLAALDALLLPLESPPAAILVELAAALHPFVNLIPVVRNADDEAVAALEHQLVTQGIQWVGPRDFDEKAASAFYRLPPARDEVKAFDGPYPPLDLSVLRERSLRLFLRWRVVDLAARSEGEVAPARGAAFAEQVARRRARLADEEELHSSADSGAAADDEGPTLTSSASGPPATVAAAVSRPRPQRVKRKHCGPFDDPLSFNLGSVAKLGLNTASKIMRLGADLVLVGAAVVTIFGAGIGLGWLGSTGLAALCDAAETAWHSIDSLRVL